MGWQHTVKELNSIEFNKNALYYIILVIYYLVLLLAAIVNITLVYALYSGRQIFFKRPFYILLSQIVLANLLNILSNLVCNVPVISFLDSNSTNAYTETSLIHSHKLIPCTVFYNFFSLFDTLAEHVIQLLVLLIAVHRSLIFVFPKIGQLFEGLCLGIVVASWIIAIGFAFFITYKSCYFKWISIETIEHPNWDYSDPFATEDPLNPITIKMNFLCDISGQPEVPQMIDLTFGSSVLLIIMIEKALLPLVVLICYVMIAVKFVFITKTTKRNYREGEILRQGVFIFFIFEAASVANFIIYSTPLTAQIALLSKRIIAGIDLLAGMLSPLLIILTCSDVKKILFGKAPPRKTPPLVIISNLHTKSV